MGKDFEKKFLHWFFKITIGVPVIAFLIQLTGFVSTRSPLWSFISTCRNICLIVLALTAVRAVIFHWLKPPYAEPNRSPQPQPSPTPVSPLKEKELEELRAERETRKAVERQRRIAEREEKEEQERRKKKEEENRKLAEKRNRSFEQAVHTALEEF